MRYILLFYFAVASCGYAQPVARTSGENLSFRIDHEEDYDIISVIYNKKLITEITEVSIDNPIIHPYKSSRSALILTDIIGSGGYYESVQYVRISIVNGNSFPIYNCHAKLNYRVRVDINSDSSGNYFRNIIWNRKLNKLMVKGEVCEVAMPLKG